MQDVHHIYNIKLKIQLIGASKDRL